MLSGLLGELAASEDAERRNALEAQAKADRAERARIEAVDAEVNLLDEMAESLTRAALILAGYHQHNRGEWRHKREQSKLSGGKVPPRRKSAKD